MRQPVAKPRGNRNLHFFLGCHFCDFHHIADALPAALGVYAHRPEFLLGAVENIELDVVHESSINIACVAGARAHDFDVVE